MTDIRDEVAQIITMALIERPNGSGLTWNELRLDWGDR